MLPTILHFYTQTYEQRYSYSLFCCGNRVSNHLKFLFTFGIYPKAKYLDLENQLKSKIKTQRFICFLSPPFSMTAKTENSKEKLEAGLIIKM